MKISFFLPKKDQCKLCINTIWEEWIYLCAVKKKSDLNATGNKPIKLLPWETDFLKIAEASENPVYSKIPGALCVGLGTSVSSSDNNDVNYDEGAEDEPDDMVALQQTVTERKIDTAKLKKYKKLKLSAETSKLTTGDL